MPEDKKLIRNARAVMTGLAGAEAAAGAVDIRIQGSRIVEMGLLTPLPGEHLFDASGCVVYPGWVNTHDHLLQSVMKGVPDGVNLALAGWLEAVPFAFRMGIDHEILETAALCGMVERLLSGCTTIADFHNLYYPGIGFEGADILFDVAERLGLRFVLCRAFGIGTASADRRPGVMTPESLDAVLTDIHRTAARYHQSAGNAHRRVVAAPSNFIRSASPEDLRRVASECRTLGLRMHSHLCEAQDDVTGCRAKYGMSPGEYAESVGWVGEDVWYAHLVRVNEDDIARLGRTATGIGHCPGSNARTGAGISPVAAMQKAGMRISIGQDGGAAAEPSSMLMEVHQSLYMQRAAFGVDAAEPVECIRWASQGGARVLGLDQTGVIAPGYEADLAIYDVDDLAGAAFHAPELIPVLRGSAPLRWLLCGGRVVVEDGQIPGFDMEALKERTRRAVLQLKTWQADIRSGTH